MVRLREKRGEVLLEIDGSYGEGGGQLLRTAIALSAVTGREVAVRDIRAKRDRPGLAPQHLAAVAAVAKVCRARVEGLSLRSREVRFAPAEISGGPQEEYRFDVGTAGSVGLVLQALLPLWVAGGHEAAVTVTGGTDVPHAPPLDYLRNVLLPLLGRLGVEAHIEAIRRGYYPRGGGEVRVEVARGSLKPLNLDERGAILAIEGRAHVSSLPEHIATRMRDAAVERCPQARVEVE
ncbi:MAG TPA: RNA 3'-terminal phosphate cyclase, partial [Vicinamibacteria bacterium]